MSQTVTSVRGMSIRVVWTDGAIGVVMTLVGIGRVGGVGDREEGMRVMIGRLGTCRDMRVSCESD